MANPVGSLLVKIGADTGDFNRGMRESQSGLQKLGSVAKTAGIAVAAAMAAAAAAVGTLALKGTVLGDELAKTAKTIGITTGELLAWRHAAQQSGIESAALEGGIKRLGKTVGDAKAGLSTAKQALADLGLSYKELEKIPLDKQMLVVGERLKNVASQTDKLRIASDIFGRTAGAKMLVLFDQTSDAIAEQLAEAKKLGSYMDSTQSRVVQEAVDAQGRMKTAFQGITLQLGSMFGPAIEAGANLVASLTAKVTALLPRLSSLAERFLGIKRAAEDLSDMELETRLNDLNVEIEEANRRYLDASRDKENQSGRNRVGAAQAYNDALQERNDLLKRYADLEAEQARRRAEGSSAGPGIPDEDSIDVQSADQRKAQLEEITVRQRLLKDETIARLEELEHRYKTERELADEQLASDLDLLAFSLERKRLTQEEHDELLARAKAEHEARLTGIEKQADEERLKNQQDTMLKRLGTIVQGYTDATAKIATGSKTMFELNKKLGIANAIISTHEAVTAVLADKTIPTIARFALAGAAAAKGAAEVAAIKGTSFGSGTTPSAAGTPTVNGAPVSDAGSGGNSTLISIEGSGSSFSRDQVRGLIEQINEAVGDGARISFK